MPTEYKQILKANFNRLSNNFVLTAISLPQGLNGNKPRIEEEENIYLNLLQVLNKYCTHNTTLVGGTLKRWNFWEMEKHLNDDSLRNILHKMPNFITEKEVAAWLAEQFLPLAKQLELNYIANLQQHLAANPSIVASLKFKPIILGWDERITVHTCATHNTFIPAEETAQEFSDIQETKNVFLKNKKHEFKITKDRFEKINPYFAQLNFEKIADEACYGLIREERLFFNHLSNTSVLYSGTTPKALASIFDSNKSTKNNQWTVLKARQKLISKSIPIPNNHANLLQVQSQLRFFSPNSPELKSLSTSPSSIDEDSSSFIFSTPTGKVKKFIDLFLLAPPEARKHPEMMEIITAATEKLQELSTQRK